MTLYVSLSSCVLFNDFRLPEMVAREVKVL